MNGSAWLVTLIFVCAGAVVTPPATAQEDLIRKNFAQRFPGWPPIDEVSASPVAGLYELRIGHRILYVDKDASHLFEGDLIETKTRTSLTEARVLKLTAIDFAALPLKDAIVVRNGNGERRIAVFADPNCSACRMQEAELQKVKDLTVYTFLLPILGEDSVVKSRDIWCSKDPAKAWLGWMLDSEKPLRVMGGCDSAVLQRNTDFSQKHRITGTPAVFFEDGTRIPGAMNSTQLEKRLAAVAASKTPSGRAAQKASSSK